MGQLSDQKGGEAKRVLQRLTLVTKCKKTANLSKISTRCEKDRSNSAGCHRDPVVQGAPKKVMRSKVPMLPIAKVIQSTERH